MTKRAANKPAETVDDANATTNLAIQKDLAVQLRTLAKTTGVTVFEITNQLIAFGLKNAKLNVERRVLTVDVADVLKKASQRK